MTKRRLNYRMVVAVTVEIDKERGPIEVRGDSEVIKNAIMETLMPHPDDALVLHGFNNLVRVMALAEDVEFTGE